MTNLQIIALECANRGISEEVHTFAMWKSLGYKVKKGEHAKFEAQIWKHSSKTIHNNDTDADETKESLYMTKAFFFGRSQVEEKEIEK